MDYGDWGHRDTATIKCVHSPKYVTQLLLPSPIYTLTHPHFLCPASHHAWTRGVGNFQLFAGLTISSFHFLLFGPEICS